MYSFTPKFPQNSKDDMLSCYIIYLLKLQLVFYSTKDHNVMLLLFWSKPKKIFTVSHSESCQLSAFVIAKIAGFEPKPAALDIDEPCCAGLPGGQQEDPGLHHLLPLHHLPHPPPHLPTHLFLQVSSDSFAGCRFRPNLCCWSRPNLCCWSEFKKSEENVLLRNSIKEE